MIHNLQDVQKYLYDFSIEFNEPIFEKKQLSVEDLNRMHERFPDLPISYRNIIENYNVNGIVIGYFLLYAYSRKINIIDQLIKVNDDPVLPVDFLERHRMYIIGSCASNKLCTTAGTECFHAGEILDVKIGGDIYNPKDSQIRPIAKDFEQFMIIAANEHQLSLDIDDDESNYAEYEQKLYDRLIALNVDPRYITSWIDVL